MTTAIAEAGGKRNSATESSTMNDATFQIRRIDAAEARPLRHAILRPNQPFEATVYPLDDEPASDHWGAFLGDRLVGVASVFNEARPGYTNPRAWRLRGMATREQDRGQGIGGALLHACLDYIRAAGGTTLWLNARTTAAAFYSRFGFVVRGNVFDIEGIGPHVVMELTL